MNQSFQDRVLGMITARIKAYGFEVSVQDQYANTGTLFGHEKGVILPSLAVGYRFQPYSYTLTITVGDRRVLSQPPRKDYYAFHHASHTATTRFWEMLDSELQSLVLGHKEEAGE